MGCVWRPCSRSCSRLRVNATVRTDSICLKWPSRVESLSVVCMITLSTLLGLVTGQGINKIVIQVSTWCDTFISQTKNFSCDLNMDIPTGQRQAIIVVQSRMMDWNRVLCNGDDDDDDDDLEIIGWYIGMIGIICRYRVSYRIHRVDLGRISTLDLSDVLARWAMIPKPCCTRDCTSTYLVLVP